MHAEKRGDRPPGTRTRSRLRKLLRWKIAIPVILVVLVLLAPVLYRQSLLWRVPDIGDPFPISEVLDPIPEADNAYPLFEEAFALRKDVADADSEEYFEQERDGWDPADELLNRYLELNRPALEKWRQATERNDRQFVPIGELTDVSSLPDVQGNRALTRWCQVEIERLTETGRAGEALPWFRASFRASGLITRNMPWLNTLVGAAMFALAVESAEKWMQHPDVTRDELLHLLRTVQESVRLMEKPSTIVQVEYVASRRAYAEWSYAEMRNVYDQAKFKPPLRSRWEAWLRAEPELSRRLAAHVAANHLPFVDLPPARASADH